MCIAKARLAAGADATEAVSQARACLAQADPPLRDWYAPLLPPPSPRTFEGD